VSAEQQLELTMLRERLRELARRRLAVGLSPAERDEYERLADREIAILADLRVEREEL
jgi:hypothetical protein